MPPKPQAQNRRRTFEISDFGAGSGECHSKKIAKTQPTKNVEKAAIVKALRVYFPIQMLLNLIALSCRVSFYPLKVKNDENAVVSQEIAIIYHDNHGNYGYRRVTFNLRETIKINHKKVQRIMQWLGLKGKFKTKNIVLIKVKSDVLRIICYNAILQLRNLIKNGQLTLLSLNVLKVSAIYRQLRIYLTMKWLIMI